MPTQAPLLPLSTTYPRQTQVQGLPLRERPAYRASYTTAACTSAELLAAVIGGPRQIETANALLSKFGSLRNLHNAPVNEISSIPGVGPQTASRLKAALAVGQRMASDPSSEKKSIISPADAAALVMYDMGTLEAEQFRVILLNTKNHVIRIETIYIGSANNIGIRVSEILKPAILAQATAIVIVHNHPSGDVTPSPDDVAVTRAIKKGAEMMDIDLLDHIIVGQAKWASLKERGLGFS